MTTYANSRYRAEDAALIRKRSVVFPSDSDETVDATLERFAVGMDEVRQLLEDRPDLTLVLDAYLTKSQDPLGEEHEPLDAEVF